MNQQCISQSQTVLATASSSFYSSTRLHILGSLGRKNLKMKLVISLVAFAAVLLTVNSGTSSLSKLTYSRWINLLRYAHKTLQREPPVFHEEHFNRTEHVKLITTAIVKHFFNDIFRRK